MHITILDTFLTIFPSRYHPHHENEAGKFKKFLKPFSRKDRFLLLMGLSPERHHLQKDY
jgi:hypothetical protein